MPKSFKALFILILLVLFGNSITLYYYTSILMNKEQWVTHSFQVIAHIESLRAELRAAGTSVRSFVILNDATFFGEFGQAREKMYEKMDEIALLIADNLEQEERLARLRPVIKERISRLEQLARLQSSTPGPAVTDYFRQNFLSNEGINAIVIINEMVATENQLLAIRSQQSQRQLRILNILVTIILLMDVVFVSLMYSFFDRYFTEKRQSEQRFRAVFDQAAVGVEEINHQGIIISCNPKLCQMLGYRAEELIGLEWKSIVHPDDLEQAARNEARLFAGEIESYTMEKRYWRKDASLVWVSLTSSAVRLNSKLSSYRLSIVTDISERKAAEDERLKLLEESQVANRLKDEFLLTISHELRTPLTIVMGHSDLLEFEEPGSADFRTSLDAIKRGAGAQLRLVNDLLDISSIASGIISLELRRLDLNEVLQRAVASLRQAAILKKIQFDFQSNRIPLWIEGDDIRLQQIFWNLLSNAVKFTEGPVRVQIEVSQGTRGAMVKVSDTGQDIEKDFLPYVFDRFRQEDGSMTRNFGWLGVGLSIAKRLVELHKGSIEVHSPGRSHGTTFLVFFPLLEIQTADTDGANSFEWEKTRQVPRGSLKGLSFLLIEDEDDARQLFATSLRMAGAHVEAVEDTRQGFHWIQKQGFDAVISDISLPGEDGYALMRRIRAYETTHRKPPVKAIALTAHAHAADKGRALEAGYDSHIAKPASPYFIVESIIQTLQKA